MVERIPVQCGVRPATTRLRTSSRLSSHCGSPPFLPPVRFPSWAKLDSLTLLPVQHSVAVRNAILVPILLSESIAPRRFNYSSHCRHITRHLSLQQRPESAAPPPRCTSTPSPRPSPCCWPRRRQHGRPASTPRIRLFCRLTPSRLTD